jgi:signal peptidase II
MRLARYLYGPHTAAGAIAAVIACALDQASKYYLLAVYELADRGVIHIMPFIDFVLVRNKGISYGLFQQEGPFGQWVLLALKAIAVVLLVIWMARSGSRLAAIGLGLIVGGAFGNAIDRLTLGWVADFVLFHIETASWRFDWYVFNIADVAIVAGVCALLYESLIGERAAKAP